MIAGDLSVGQAGGVGRPWPSAARSPRDPHPRRAPRGRRVTRTRAERRRVPRGRRVTRTRAERRRVPRGRRVTPTRAGRGSPDPAQMLDR
jgi:hypothetical protein